MQDEKVAIIMSAVIKMIAIIPPPIVFTFIRKEQEFISQEWGAHHALRTPPHMTIIPPISLTREDIPLIFSMAYAISNAFHPFDIALHGFGTFKPRVVFIKPVKNDILQSLQATWDSAIRQKIPHILANYPDRPYHPHITLAHKDVRREQFEKIWMHYADKSYEASFTAKGFSILTHTPEGWIPEETFNFT